MFTKKWKLRLIFVVAWIPIFFLLIFFIIVAPFLLMDDLILRNLLFNLVGQSFLLLLILIVSWLFLFDFFYPLYKWKKLPKSKTSFKFGLSFFFWWIIILFGWGTYNYAFDYYWYSTYWKEYLKQIEKCIVYDFYVPSWRDKPLEVKCNWERLQIKTLNKSGKFSIWDTCDLLLLPRTKLLVNHVCK